MVDGKEENPVGWKKIHSLRGRGMTEERSIKKGKETGRKEDQNLGTERTGTRSRKARSLGKKGGGRARDRRNKIQRGRLERKKRKKAERIGKGTKLYGRDGKSR